MLSCCPHAEQNFAQVAPVVQKVEQVCFRDFYEHNFFVCMSLNDIRFASKHFKLKQCTLMR